MTIETYLRELAGLLPSTRRTRVLAEVEAHLREATETRVHEGATRSDAEAAAVEAFGSPHVVAASIWRSTAPIAIRRAAGVALAALASLVLPLYAVPENLLPPAPWDERPAYLGVLLAVALAFWLAALALAAVAALVRPRLAAAGLALAAVARSAASARRSQRRSPGTSRPPRRPGRSSRSALRRPPSSWPRSPPRPRGLAHVPTASVTTCN